MTGNIESFGRYPKVNHEKIEYMNWRSEIPAFDEGISLLPYGLGKSYGDSCLNTGGGLILTRGMNKLISFNPETGLIDAEAGITLAELIEFLLPRGFFLPVTPGTKYVTLGGAIANDVHGKNHHVMGTFGRHVTRFELVRSDGERITCTPEQNTELYKATIGGLGLTGIITRAEFRAVRCPGPMIAAENIKYNALDEFFEINNESEDYPFTVSWVDTTAKGKKMSRGIYSRGDFAAEDKQPVKPGEIINPLPFPPDYPFINSFTVKAFNFLYFNKQLSRRKKSIIHYEPFFYPLDKVDGWNKAYGKKGFLQYQFILPNEIARNVLPEIFGIIQRSGLSSFLTVLKKFGDIESPGMLSFPRAGITLAIDFRMEGRKTLEILDKCDEIVAANGGIIYPAKDARMSGKHFRQFYPQWEEFSKFIDSKFSSAFWRRVTEK
jgi:FAD/FMN-containing dehydrogenase